SGSRTFVFADGSSVVDSGGIAFDGESLAFEGSLAGNFIDLAFMGETPIVLRQGEVTAYSSALLPTAPARTP
ncbi:MAG: hypothetical protein KDI09_13455, partial [Halioglobus sp.]|nr:hypothetical protein [Halioglobus sp.]